MTGGSALLAARLFAVIAGEMALEYVPGRLLRLNQDRARHSRKAGSPAIVKIGV